MTENRYPAMLDGMARALSVDANQLDAVLRDTVMPKASPAQVQAFMLVATKHKLNPVTKEIYAYPAKGGGIQALVGIDGWLKLANDHPAFDGMTFAYEYQGEGDARRIDAVTCRIHRKDRAHPIEAVEFYDECVRPTDPWRTMPRRMLTTRAMAQAIRRAFSFSGLIDEDEGKAWVAGDAGKAPVTLEHAPKAEAPQTRATLDDLRGQVEDEPELDAAPENEPEPELTDAQRAMLEEAQAKTGDALFDEGDTTDPEGAQ